MNRTIFITGASSGIGKATALFFANKGWNVVATMRQPEYETDLKHPRIKLLRLDVTDEIRIREVITEALNIFDTIDVLFNNAGYALVGSFEAMSSDQIKGQFETNVFGVMNVTKAFLPYFRSIKAGTIITTTSMGGLITFPLYSVYHGTKWAVEGFMESLHYELRPFNIKVKNIEPGAIKTDFYSSLHFVSRPEYDSYVSIAHQNMLQAGAKAPGPEVVAHKVWEAANDSSYRLRYPVGGNGPLLLFIRWLVPLNWFFGIVRSQVEKGIK